MKKHFGLVFCLLLAGCTDTDWDRALNYVYPAPDDADVTSDAVPRPAAPAQPATSVATPDTAQAAAPAGNADFCRAVATQDASGNDFDPATQQRVFARSYAQCVAIYSR
jgi:hypothetical protein